MNFNSEYKTIFWHVPKTAGRSIGELPFVTLRSHYPIAIAVREQHPEEWESSFKFAFVRNPMDRFVSLYHYFLQPQPRYRRRWTGRNQRLHAIALYCEARGGFASFCAKLHKSRIMQRDMHFWPQHRWICDNYGCCLMDFVGRYETLQEDIRQVAGRLEVEAPELPHRNPSPHGPWQDYYHTKSRVKLITDFYHEDFAIFNYEMAVV